MIRREEKAEYSWEELKAIVDDLRGEEGCPWDREQTMDSLKKYLKNETEEVFEAVDAGDMENLCEELGDVLFELLLFARIASEQGAFTMDDVVSGIARKMVRRHPHVFSDQHYETAEEQLAAWQEIKAREKKEKQKNCSLDK